MIEQMIDNPWWWLGLAVLLGMGVYLWMTDISSAATTSRAAEPFTDLTRKASLLAAVWIAAVCGLAAWYRVPFTRPVWGMAMGLGINAAIAMMNSAAFGLSPSFERAWALVSQAHFSVMMLFWAWGFWVPPPAPASERPNHDHAGEAAAWSKQWQRLRVLAGSLLGKGRPPH